MKEYKKRIRKVIQDFETYGNDPSKMVAWTPSKRKPSNRNKIQEKTTMEDAEHTASPIETLERESGSLTRFELPLRPNMKAIILTPSDLTSEEVDKILSAIDKGNMLSKGGISIGQILDQSKLSPEAKSYFKKALESCEGKTFGQKTPSEDVYYEPKYFNELMKKV